MLVNTKKNVCKIPRKLLMVIQSRHILLLLGTLSLSFDDNVPLSQENCPSSVSVMSFWMLLTTVLL